MRESQRKGAAKPYMYLYRFMDNDDATEGFSNLGIILCVQRYDSTILVENKVVVAEALSP